MKEVKALFVGFPLCAAFILFFVWIGEDGNQSLIYCLACVGFSAVSNVIINSFKKD